MKTSHRLSILILVGLVLVSCSPKDVVEEAAPPPAPEEAPEIVSGACGVSYFPILPDTTWVYRTEDEEGLFVENKVWYEDITDDSFVWKQEMEGDPPITAESVWTCSEDGLISTDYAATNIPQIMETMEYDFDYSIETLEFSGITFPAEAQWVVGSEWVGSWKVVSEIDVEGMGMVNADIDVTMNSVIAAEEAITVPAGTYEKALRVDSIMYIEVGFKMAGLTVPAMQSEYEMSSWYVQGVGMVKQSSPGADFLMELAAIQ